LNTPLILDKKALEDLGLASEVSYLFEYDLPSAFKNTHKDTLEISAQYTKKQAEFFRELRNKTMFALRFKLRAIKNLYSSWFINEDMLESAQKFAEELRAELIKEGFSDRAEKVRIIPIVTTVEGYQTYEQRKEEFFLEFLGESQKTIDKGVKDKNLSESLLWRVKKASEIVSMLKETLKDKSKKSRYNEIVDSLTMLDDSIARYEQIKEQKKAKEQKAKTKDTKRTQTKANTKRTQTTKRTSVKAKA